VVRNIITLLTLGTDLHIMSRYVWRIINPVGQLSRRKHVDEVSAVAGHQDMLARNDHGGNHDVGIALPSAMLASQEQTLGNALSGTSGEIFNDKRVWVFSRVCLSHLSLPLTR
jgi:hypothetical protein